MMQQVNIPPASTTNTPAVARGWLTRLSKRLMPGHDGVLMLAAYVMILTAIVTLVLNGQELPVWRFYGALGALLALLVVNITLNDIEMRWTGNTGLWLVLGLSAVLFLIASWLAVGVTFSFVPYLLYMLAAQAIVSLNLRQGFLFVGGLLAGWAAVLALAALPAQTILHSVLSLSLGLVFTLIFALTLLGYNRQRQAAEALLVQLQHANAELEAAREREKELAVAEERVRLARDIHDGLGHHLTVLSVQLQAASRLLPHDQARAEAALTICHSEAQAALTEVRHSVAAVRRTPLDHRSLEQALQALVHEFDQHSLLQARFVRHGAVVELTPAAMMTLYRAAQEGLTNAQKHAAAQHVTVNLHFTPATVRLRIHDDGAGISSSIGGGFGLAGLRERAAQFGGSLTAHPEPTGGFTLTIELPLREA